MCSFIRSKPFPVVFLFLLPAFALPSAADASAIYNVELSVDVAVFSLSVPPTGDLSFGGSGSSTSTIAVVNPLGSPGSDAQAEAVVSSPLSEDLAISGTAVFAGIGPVSARSVARADAFINLTNGTLLDFYGSLIVDILGFYLGRIDLPDVENARYSASSIFSIYDPFGPPSAIEEHVLINSTGQFGAFPNLGVFDSQETFDFYVPAGESRQLKLVTELRGNASAPEPSVMVLLGLGCVGLVARQRCTRHI